MINGGIEVHLFTQIHLILEGSFGDNLSNNIETSK